MEGRTVASRLTRLAASVARLKSEYFASGAENVSSTYTPTTVYRPFISPVSALENSPDRISEAMFCCHSWVSASFAVMASPLRLKEEAFLGLFEARFQVVPSRSNLSIPIYLGDPSETRSFLTTSPSLGVDYLQSCPSRIDEVLNHMVQAHPIQRNQSSVATENPSFTIRSRRSNAVVKSSFVAADQVWGKIGAII
jgi:hypothetical protein